MAKQKDSRHPIDVYVGNKLRDARAVRGWSQQYLGAQVDKPITFQQVQKYERGINRISASKLHEFATLLKLPMAYFFPEGEAQEIPLLDRSEAALLDDYRALPLESRKALKTLITAMRKTNGL